MAPPRRPRKRNSYHKKAENAISAENRDSSEVNELVQMKKEDDQECMLCKHKDLDELQYGPMYKLGDVVIHYFCILLSTLAVQHGDDHEGIWGFLVKDIKTELKRGSKMVCCYCRKNGASIQCYYKQCGKIFHLPCGLKNGSLHQFFYQFRSFCQQHRSVQRVDMNVLNNIKNPVQCVICTDDVEPSPMLDSLWAPCCKTAWFHRKCIQEMALNSGYFFKCPLCNNIETFRTKMLNLGIYIPSRDASWEMVPNAFSELLVRPSECSASNCLCPTKNNEKKDNCNDDDDNNDASDNATKKTNEKEDEWQTLVICNTCGSVAIHMQCGGLKNEEDTWDCDSCKVIVERCSAKKRKLELTHDETVASTSRLTNGETITLNNGITCNPTHISTSVVTRKSAKLSSNGLLNIHTQASTSELCNGHVKTTNNLPKRRARASTSRLRNRYAEATNTLPTKVTQSSVYGLATIQEASTSGLSTRKSHGPTNRLPNEQDQVYNGLSSRQARASTSELCNGYAEATNVIPTRLIQSSSNELQNRKSQGHTNCLPNIQEQVKLPSSQARTFTRGLCDDKQCNDSTSGKLQAPSTRPSNEKAEISNGQTSSVSRLKNRSSTNEPSVSLQSLSSRGYNLRRSITRSFNSTECNEVNTNINLKTTLESELNPLFLTQKTNETNKSTNPRVTNGGIITISDDDSDEDIQITGFIPRPEVPLPRPQSPVFRIENVISMSVHDKDNSSCTHCTIQNLPIHIMDNIDLTLDDD